MSSDYDKVPIRDVYIDPSRVFSECLVIESVVPESDLDTMSWIQSMYSQPGIKLPSDERLFILKFRPTEVTITDVRKMASHQGYTLSEEFQGFCDTVLDITEEDSPRYWIDQDGVHAPDDVTSLMTESIGPFQSNQLKYNDRRFRFGIDKTECTPSTDSVIEKIALRQSPAYSSKPSTQPMTDVLGALNDLDRFPMLVLIDHTDASRQLDLINTEVSNYVDTRRQSVLSRAPGDSPEYKFNNLIHSRGLNNWVDKNTQVVYIFGNTLPKVMLKSGWIPVTCLVNTSIILSTRVKRYVERHCDLIIYREEHQSLYRRHSNQYTHI